MRHLFACTCLTPLVLAIHPTLLKAETVIGTAITTPVATSTANGGAADSIRISSAGSVKPAAGTAVTADSTHAVTNEGTIQITGASNATGIFGANGASGTITNASAGKIVIDESYAPTDTDNDGDLDGPFAQGSNRFGIRVAPGGSYTGNIVNAGTITIEGNQSAGIALDGRLDGSLTSSGTINVTGNDSAGIRAGDVTGDVRLTGTITAQGANSVGVDLKGDIGGALSFQGAVSATGYRNPTSPADPSKLDADDLLQGGGAVRIAGNVGGGILFDAPPRDTSSTDTDEDKDGVPDAQEGTAAITSTGQAAAVTIGAADRDVVIGALAGAGNNGHGLVINGAIAGNGAYNGVGGNGLVIGRLGGHVSIAGGMTVNGTVSATGGNAAATAIRVGSGATMQEIRIGGTVSATGSGNANVVSSAIVIDAGAAVSTVRNSGTIRATQSGGGFAGGIIDRSGSVDLVENSGTISATGTDLAADHVLAIDLSANAGGATVRQTVAATGANAGSITGTVLFGAGNDLLDLADGTMTGEARFGAGDNRLQLGGDAVFKGNAVFGAGADAMILAGTTSFTGKADFGGGADSLSLTGTARFTGTLVGSQGLAVSVAGGTLEIAGTGTVGLASLALSGGGTMSLNIDSAAGTNTLYQVGGTATFGADSKLLVRLDSVTEAEGHYVFLRAGSVTGAGNLTAIGTMLPFLFKGDIATTPTPGELAVDITRKSATELGLNRSQASAYDAIFAVLDEDEDVAGVYLDIVDGKAFRHTLAQMLPNHAGGLFEAVTQGSRATARILADPKAPYAAMDGWGFWLQQVGWGVSKNLGDTAAYDITGWGASGGADVRLGDVGNVGLSLAYLHGRDSDGSVENEVNADQYEIAAYWRLTTGGLIAHARASYAMIGFDGARNFLGRTGGEAVERRSEATWDGTLWSASAGAAYELGFGRMSLRPVALVEYYRLSEDGYTETGGGDAFDLIVAERDSDELAVTGSVAVGLNFGRQTDDSGWFRAEIEGGRRQIVGGELGATTAKFASGGNNFTLTPDARTDGWTGRVRLIGGNQGFTIGGDFGAEEQQGHAAISFRASISLKL